MKKRIATLVPLLLVFGLGACITSVTESFEYDVFKENGLTEIDLEGQDPYIESIDLTTDSTFKDNQSEIKNVDRVTFKTDLYTKNEADAIVDMYFRLDSTDDWMVLVQGLTVSAASTAGALTKITYTDSEGLIQNFEKFQKLAEKGIMEIGRDARTGNDAVVVKSLVLYVAFSGG